MDKPAGAVTVETIIAEMRDCSQGWQERPYGDDGFARGQVERATVIGRRIDGWADQLAALRAPVVPSGTLDCACQWRTRAEALQAELAQVKEERDRLKAARRIHELDNHHNAMMCPYCNPGLIDYPEQLAALRTAIEGLRDDIQARAKTCRDLAEATPDDELRSATDSTAATWELARDLLTALRTTGQETPR